MDGVRPQVPEEASAILPPAEGAKPKRMSGDARRRQLIQAAIRLFAEKGFQGTTTKEIAAAAGVNEAMIFRHFATKQDLYAAILDHQAHQVNTEAWLAELREYAERRDDQGLFTALASKIIDRGIRREFLNLMLYSALEGHELARMFRERQVLPLHGFLRDYVVRRQREGAFQRLDPDATVRAFIGMCSYHAMINELFGRDVIEVTDQGAISTFSRAFLNGLWMRKTRPSRKARTPHK